MKPEEILELVRAGYSKDEINGMSTTETVDTTGTVVTTTETVVTQTEDTQTTETETVDTSTQTETTSTSNETIDSLNQKIAELEKKLKQQNISKPIETAQNPKESTIVAQSQKSGLDEVLEALLD